MIGNLKSSLKNTLIYGAGNLATKLVGFILIPLYVKHFPINVYGELGLLEVTGAAFVSILGLALTQALYRWYYDKEFLDRQKSMFFTLLVFLTVFLTVTFLIFSGFTYKLSYLIFGVDGFKELIDILLIASSLQILMQTISTLIQLQQKAVLFTISNTIVLIVQLFLTIYFIAYLNLGLYGIYYAQIISLCLFFVIVSPFTIKNIKAHFEVKMITNMLGYSAPWLLSNIAALVIGTSDRYFIRAFAEMSDLGLYQFGYKIANTLSVLVIASAQMSIFPIMFKKMNDPDADRFYSKIMTYFTFGLMFFVLFLNLYGLEIVKFLARKKEYWDSFSFIPYISLGLVFSMLKDLSSIPLQIKKKSFLISKIIIFSAVFCLLLNWLLIPFWGSKGAAIAFIIGQVFYFSTMLFFAQKHYRINYELLKIIKMLIVSIGLYFISLLFNDLTLIIRLISKVLLIASFPIILYFWNFFEKVELESLSGFWRKWKNPGHLKSNIKDALKGDTA